MRSAANLIFLCHATENKPNVRDLYNMLNTNNLNPWLDEINILPGQDWDYEIKKAMKAASFALICLSSISVRKIGYVQKEIKLALDKQDEMPEGEVFLIPIKLEPCDLPDRLSHLQAVDFFKPDGFDRLLTTLTCQPDNNQAQDNSVIKSSGANPFYCGGAVPSNIFYGRKDVLQAINDRLDGSQLQSLSIVGDRCMGKSSVLRYVKEKLIHDLESKHNFIVIYLDLMKAYCHKRKGIMRFLRRELTKLWKEPWHSNEDGDLSAFDFALEDLENDEIKLILLMDEMDNLTRDPDEFDDLLEDFRANGQMDQMAIITASYLPLADLCKINGVSSPFFNIFEEKRLTMFKTNEWKQLITDHIDVDNDIFQFINDMAGGHPLFTQMAGSLLWKIKDQGRSIDINQCQMELFEQIQPYIEYFWNKLSDDEQSAMKYTAGFSKKAPKEKILRKLNTSGILLNNKPFCVSLIKFIEGLINE